MHLALLLYILSAAPLDYAPSHLSSQGVDLDKQHRPYDLRLRNETYQILA